MRSCTRVSKIQPLTCGEQPHPEKRIDQCSNHDGMETRFTDPAGRTSLEVDVALMDCIPKQVGTIERRLYPRDPENDSVAVHLLPRIPNAGKPPALAILYEIHDSNRCHKAGNIISCARLVKGAHESAGNRRTGKKAKIGNVHLK